MLRDLRGVRRTHSGLSGPEAPVAGPWIKSRAGDRKRGRARPVPMRRRERRAPRDHRRGGAGAWHRALLPLDRRKVGRG